MSFSCSLHPRWRVVILFGADVHRRHVDQGREHPADIKLGPREHHPAPAKKDLKHGPPAPAGPSLYVPLYSQSTPQPWPYNTIPSPRFSMAPWCSGRQNTAQDAACGVLPCCASAGASTALPCGAPVVYLGGVGDGGRVQTTARYLPEEKMRSLRQLFQEVDADGSGLLSLERTPGGIAARGGGHVLRRRAQRVCVCGPGRERADRLHGVCGGLHGHAAGEHTAEIRRAFEELDSDQSGSIEVREFVDVCVKHNMGEGRDPGAGGGRPRGCGALPQVPLPTLTQHCQCCERLHSSLLGFALLEQANAECRYPWPGYPKKR